MFVLYKQKNSHFYKKLLDFITIKRYSNSIVDLTLYYNKAKRIIYSTNEGV